MARRIELLLPSEVAAPQEEPLTHAAGLRLALAYAQPVAILVEGAESEEDFLSIVQASQALRPAPLVLAVVDSRLTAERALSLGAGGVLSEGVSTARFIQRAKSSPAGADDVVRRAALEQLEFLEREAWEATQAAQLLGALAENLPEAVLLVSSDRRIQYVNAAAKLLSELAPGAMVGRPLEELPFDETVRGLLTTETETVFREGKVRRSEVQQGARLDGPRYIELLFAPIAARAATDKVIIAARDVTERRKAQEEAERMARYQEHVVGIVGHDLKNPLNSLLLSAGQLVAKLSEPELHTAVRIQRVGQRMARMISDLFDFARVTSGGGIPVDPRPADLRAICQNALEELVDSEPSAHFEFTVRGDVTGHWDPVRLHQVISNLVGNALRHGDPAQPVRVSIAESGSVVWLEVCNAGSSIPEAEQALLFEPFRRGPRSAGSKAQGLGLGLFIVDQVARAHGGTVEVRSEPGGEVCFRVLLPRTPSG